MRVNLLAVVALAFVLVACDPKNPALQHANESEDSREAVPEAGPSPDEALIERALVAVGETLLDPNSAQYQKVRVFTDGVGIQKVCGEVNGKNRYGGYVGFKPFAVGIGDTVWSSFSLGESSGSMRSLIDCMTRAKCGESGPDVLAAIEACSVRE